MRVFARFIILLLFITSPLNAQIDYLQFDQLSNGLSTNIVNAIFQDSKGWIWLSTSEGLNRYDGASLKTFKSDPNDSTSIKGDLVRFIFEDSKGQLWVGTENGGLNLFNYDTETFTWYPEYDNQNKPVTYIANTIAEDRKGNIWIGTNLGLKKVNLNTKRFTTYAHSDIDPESLSHNFIRKISFDRFDKLWVGTKEGLDLFDETKRKFRHINLFEKTAIDNTVHEIYEDNKGLLWIGTYSYGIFIIDPKSFDFKPFKFDSNNSTSLTVRSILQDNNDNYWIGTRNGLFIYNETTGKINHFLHDNKFSKSLCHNSILSMFKDKRGDIWIGTRGGISHLVFDKQIFRHYSSYEEDNHYLNSSDIYAFWYSPDHKLWVGTDFGGINVLDLRTQTFKYITTPKNGSGNLSSIKSIINDENGNLWIGSYLGGINVYNRNTGNITHYTYKEGDENGLIDSRVWTIFRDSRNNIWVGTGRGIDRYDPKTKNFIHYNSSITTKPVDWISEDSEKVLWIGTNPDIFLFDLVSGSVKKISIGVRSHCFYEDHKHRIWIATETKGLILLDKRNGKILKYYDESKGIASNSTLSILEDNQNNLWIGTANGLSKFNPDKELFLNFDKNDGTQITHYNYGASLKLPDGKLAFGGYNGFVIFDPSKIKEVPNTTPVKLTDFKLFNKSVQIGDIDSPLKKHISECKSIELKYNENFITLSFVALNYTTPDHNKYKYMLEGVDKTWNYVGNQREATYTNLEPGNYTFRVISSTNINNWDYQGTTLNIKIKAPFYKTTAAKFLLVIILIAMIFIIMYLRTIRVKRKNILLEKLVADKTHDLHKLAVELEESQSEVMAQNDEIENRNASLRELNERILLQNKALELHSSELEKKVKERTAQLELAKARAEESDKLKSLFLANMSHEIRTPMNSIVGLSNLLLDEDISAEDKKFLSLNIKKNSVILLHLINEILDISIIESGKLSINKKQVNLNELFRDIHQVFEIDKQWLDKSHINLTLNIPDDEISVCTDPVRIEQIIRNLLHNALKFTEKGSVEIGFNAGVKDILFYVKDTGIGIPPDKIDLIFDRFVKLQNSDLQDNNNLGVGLGLAICLKLVHLLGGKIWVNSVLNQGSTFYISLPAD